MPSSFVHFFSSLQRRASDPNNTGKFILYARIISPSCLAHKDHQHETPPQHLVCLASKDPCNSYAYPCYSSLPGAQKGFFKVGGGMAQAQ